MLLALGLSCGGDDKGGSGDTALDACLSPTPPATDGPLDDSTTSTSTSTSGGSSMGSTTIVDIDTGPCLSPPPEESTSSGSDSGTDSGTDSGSSGSSGGLGDAPQGDTRAAAIERVLSRGTLPSDIASRLRGRDRGGS